MTGSRTLTAAGALVATLAVAGCSFSGSASSPAGSTPHASATASTATPSTAAPSTTTPPATSRTSPPPSPSTPAGQQPPASPPPGTAAGSAGSDDADPSRCATADLTISVATGQGAMGALYDSVVLKDTGSSTCTLYGYPGVSYVAGPDGHQVGAAASRDITGSSPQRVTLGPGDVAHAALKIVHYEAYPTERCQPQPVDGYRIYPPGSKDAAFVRQGGSTCSAQDSGVLSVQPVVPGPPPAP